MDIPPEASLKKEFDNISLLSEHVYSRQLCFDSALKKENFLKNRYLNVLPEESTRVKLRQLEGEEFSDYINANFISSPMPNSNRKFISTQAPLPHTTADFWRCAWEQQIFVICMVTRLVEGNKQKAHCYWPLEIGETLESGDFTVSLKSYEDLTNIEVRTLYLSYRGETRTIVHILYSEWPDFGVPSSSAKVRELIHILETNQHLGERTGLSGPPMIHCSAGIGRTGALLGILFSLEKLRKGTSLEELNIMDIVLSLRKQRPGMVQTADQYRFIYTVVGDFVTHDAAALKPVSKSSKKRSKQKSSRQRKNSKTCIPIENTSTAETFSPVLVVQN